MTKGRLVFGIGASAVVMFALVFVLGGHASRAPGQDSTPEAVSPQTPRVYPPLSAELPSPPARLDEHATAPTAAPSPAAILYRDSNDYARGIADKPAFKAFASSANLTPDERAQVSHILALYSMDDESLRNSTKDPDKLSSMRKQLLIHMHVRVRTKIPTKWEAFEQSNLLPSVSDFGNSPT